MKHKAMMVTDAEFSWAMDLMAAEEALQYELELQRKPKRHKNKANCIRSRDDDGNPILHEMSSNYD